VLAYIAFDIEANQVENVVPIVASVSAHAYAAKLTEGVSMNVQLPRLNKIIK
jgi:hypothetical protein